MAAAATEIVAESQFAVVNVGSKRKAECPLDELRLPEDASIRWSLIARDPTMPELDVRLWDIADATGVIHTSVMCLTDRSVCGLIAEYAQARVRLTAMVDVGRGGEPRLAVEFNSGDTTQRLVAEVFRQRPNTGGHYARFSLDGRQSQHPYDALTYGSYCMTWVDAKSFSAAGERLIHTSVTPTRPYELKQRYHGELLPDEQREVLRMSGGYAFVGTQPVIDWTVTHTCQHRRWYQQSLCVASGLVACGSCGGYGCAGSSNVSGIVTCAAPGCGAKACCHCVFGYRVECNGVGHFICADHAPATRARTSDSAL